MNTRAFGVLFAAALYLTTADSCYARELLFYKVSRNYDSEGLLGRVKRRELETRLFMHPTWHQRLYCNPYEPDIDETLEVYAKADASPWLSYRRATPSLSGLIFARTSLGAQFDLKTKLDAVRITRQEVALPANVASEIDFLWRVMLPGLPRDPDPEERVIIPHAPAIIAFASAGDSVKTGRIAMAAYNTPANRMFRDIVDDLIKVCDRGGSPKGPIFARLPGKIRALRVRLEKP